MNVAGRLLWGDLKRGDLVLGHFEESALVADTQEKLTGYVITFVGGFGVRVWTFSQLSPVPLSVTVLRVPFTIVE